MKIFLRILLKRLWRLFKWGALLAVLAYGVLWAGARFTGRDELLKQVNTAINDVAVTSVDNILQRANRLLDGMLVKAANPSASATMSAVEREQARDRLLKSLFSLLAGGACFVLLRRAIAGIAHYNPEDVSGAELVKYLKRITLSKFVKVVFVGVSFYIASRYALKGRFDIRWLCIILEGALLGIAAEQVITKVPRIVRSVVEWLKWKFGGAQPYVSLVLSEARFGILKPLAALTAGRDLAQFTQWAVFRIAEPLAEEMFKALVREKMIDANNQHLNDWNEKMNARSRWQKIKDGVGGLFGKPPSVHFEELSDEEIAAIETEAQEQAEAAAIYQAHNFMMEEVKSVRRSILAQICIGLLAPFSYWLVINFIVNPVIIRMAGTTFEYFARNQLYETAQIVTKLL